MLETKGAYKKEKKGGDLSTDGDDRPNTAEVQEEELPKSFREPIE